MAIGVGVGCKGAQRNVQVGGTGVETKNDTKSKTPKKEPKKKPKRTRNTINLPRVFANGRSQSKAAGSAALGQPHEETGLGGGTGGGITDRVGEVAHHRGKDGTSSSGAEALGTNDSPQNTKNRRIAVTGPHDQGPALVMLPGEANPRNKVEKHLVSRSHGEFFIFFCLPTVSTSTQNENNCLRTNRLE